MKRNLMRLVVPLGLFGVVAVVQAADHIDSNSVQADPTADITDVYAWMSSDASKLNLVLNVAPFATSTSAFSDAVQYAFHIQSSASYGGTPSAESLIICEFDAAGVIECWGGGSYVTGDPSDTAGITSDDGVLKVFAGLRDDPFFFNLDGFNETVAIVVDAASALTFDEDGCPTIDEPTSDVLVTQLQSDADDEPATDDLAGSNVLSLVVQIDKTAVNSDGPILSVWGSTHMKN